MSEYVIANKSDLVSVAEAIREKSGITDTLTFPTGFVSAIGEIQSNSGDDEAAVEYVNFRDYDGTVLYSYTVEEAAALTQLPLLPTHEGLVCQGWNWTLTDIKEMGRAVEVGAMYITDDGKTHIYIHLEEEWKSPMLGICLNGTATVDWGDGTMTDTLVGTSVEEEIWTSNHEYVTAGDYVIKLTVDGTASFSANKLGSIMCHSNTSCNQDLMYSNFVRKIELGNNITAIGNNTFYNCSNLSSITLPNNVTAIGDKAFYNCYNLLSITLPNSITTIGDYAFCNCTNLLSITLSNNITAIGSYAFRNCYKLISITLPNSITTIGNNAFGSCNSFLSVTLPNNITAIGDNTFFWCINLSSITLSNNITTIGNDAFRNCCSLLSITLPNSITTIGNNAFRNCTNLLSITLPNSVTTIGNDAFYSCTNLSSIILPDSVTTIGNEVFDFCYNLSSVTLSNNITTIGNNAFHNCFNLSSIILPDSVTTIGDYAFDYCYKLTSVTLSNNITTIGNNAFYGCYSLSSIILPNSVTTIGDNIFYGCDKLTSITLSNNITTIGNNAFYDCNSLLSITLPNSITTIGNDAFRNCSNLSSIILPDSVTTIGNNAFRNCTNLLSITLPNSVTTIGDYAFYCCNKFLSITLPNSITTIGDYAFNNCFNVRYYDFSTFTTIPELGGTNVFNSIFDNPYANTKIRVPLSLYKIWIKSEHWSDYSDYITYVGTPYWVNISSNDGGAVTPTGQVLAAPADNISLKIVPDDTHTLSDITLDGASIKDDTVYYDFSGQSYSVSSVDGATYGFTLNSDGYYESNNQGVNSSAALCKIVFNLSAEKQVTIDAITYGESNYDYGLLGAVDQVLDTTSTVDSGIFWNGKGKSSADPYQVTYTIPAGEHFVYAKYIKDSSADKNKDSLQFKVNLETKSYYTYDINNVQSDHTVVVTFGDTPT